MIDLSDARGRVAVDLATPGVDGRGIPRGSWSRGAYRR
jgi:hypothetical protein